MHPLIARLELSGPLDADERADVLHACAATADIPAGQVIVPEGSFPEFSTVILGGWACRYKVTKAGGRQIMSFQLPGDWADLHSYFIEPIDHSLSALGDCRVARVPHAAVRALFAKHPRLAGVLWRATLLESAVFREWVVNIGARPANQRLAHLLCETEARLDAVGLGPLASRLPLTQAEIADSIGVTTVHVNRVLRQLGDLGLLQHGRGAVRVESWPALRAFADFDPAYLHLQPQTRTAMDCEASWAIRA